MLTRHTVGNDTFSHQMLLADITKQANLPNKDIQWLLTTLPSTPSDLTNEIISLALSKVSRVSHSAATTIYAQGYSCVNTYTHSDSSVAVYLARRDILPVLKSQADWQYINFNIRRTSINTLLPYKSRMTAEDKQISTIIIRNLRRLNRSKPSKQARTLINYLVKELKYND